MKFKIKVTDLKTGKEVVPEGSGWAIIDEELWLVDFGRQEDNITLVDGDAYKMEGEYKIQIEQKQNY